MRYLKWCLPNIVEVRLQMVLVRLANRLNCAAATLIRVYGSNIPSLNGDTITVDEA